MAAEDPELTPGSDRRRWKGDSEIDASLPPSVASEEDGFSLEQFESAPATRPGGPPPLPRKATAKIEESPAPTDEFDQVEDPGDVAMLVEPDEPWWHVGRGSVRSFASFSVSLFFHLILLLALALYVLPPEKTAKLRVMVVDAIERELEQELETVELDQQEHAATTISVLETGGDPESGPARVEFRAAENVRIDNELMDQLNNATDAAEISIDGLLDIDFSRGDILDELPDGTLGVARAVVDGYGEAFDRITQEIQQMLYAGPVLVVWCFDRSESMKDDQQEIRERIERVYAELGLLSHASSGALKTAITSFGEGFAVHTPEPTHDTLEIKAAIGSLATDPSGKEFMCSAVARSITAFREKANRQRRRMALILVSDESGEREENVGHLEATIKVAEDARCRIYVLGREAVFGYPHVRFRYRHPQTRRVHWLIADRGPETAFVEQLQTNGFRRRWDAFGSAFGPYEQSRMSRKTGGIFFLLPSKEANIVRGEKRRYELEQMRHYKPDLRARQEIFFDRDQSELRMMLWKVIHDLDPMNPNSKDVTEVRVHFSPDPATFARQVSTQIPRAKIYLGYLDEAIRFVEEHRALCDKEREIRWRANYQLLLPQLIAYQARLYEYTAYLQLFVKNPQVVPLTKPPNLRLTYWDIDTRTETLTGDVIKPFVEKASRLFDEVIQDHPGTPWAERAQWELNRGFGVRLRPIYEPPYVNVKNPKPLPKL